MATHCENCLHDNADDANFCVNCGSILARVCPRCARRNPLRGAFCAGCGLSLIDREEMPSAAAAKPVGSSSALETRSAREGERKQVSVLFADIAGSTALIETLDPEEAAAQLGAVTSAMRDAVARFEGTVNKMQGDGVMALFGAPIPHEDHAVRACCAALAIVDNVRAISDGVGVRVGIHTGEVVVRTVSNDLSVQYEAHGISVHIAARLEQEAARSGVAISEATLKAAGDSIVAEPLGKRSLRGVRDPLAVFALKSVRSGSRLEQFRAVHLLSPFVGRDLEQTILARALEAADAGASRVVGILGEAGSGKSRLVFEFLKACHAQGRSVLEARATSHGRVTPLQAVIELMRGFFRISEDTAHDVAAQRVRETTARFGCAANTASFLEFLGLPRSDGETVPTDQTLRRLLLLEAVRVLARAVAASLRAVVVVEDLHWLDAASEPFLEALAESFAGTGSLLLVNHRPGYHAAWMDRPFYERIALVPLAANAVGAMLDHVMGDDDSVRNLRQRVIDRAAGNPFFAEELVRGLVEQDVLSGPPGGFRAAPSATEAPLPATVLSLLGTRIDRLDEADKLVLQSAAVVGRQFPLAAVATIAETSLEATRAAAHRLRAAGMIFDQLGGQRDDFAFHHPLVQEAAYSSLLTERRRQLHRRAAAALTSHYQDRAGEFAALVAHHWEQAGDVLQAAGALLKAALWVGSRDVEQALRSLRGVRRLLERAPPSQPVEYMSMLASGQLVNFAWLAGVNAAEIEPEFEQAMSLARKLKDMRAAALITMAYGRALVATGSAQAYVAKVEEAQRLLEAQSLPSVEAVLAAVYSHALMTAGALAEALKANSHALSCVDRIERRDRETLGFDPEHWLQTQRARICMLMGDLAAAEEVVDRILSIPSANTVHRAIALAIRIEGCARSGRAAQASQAADRLADLLRGDSTPYLKVLGNRFQAIALIASGSSGAGVKLLRETLQYAREHRAALEMEPFILAALVRGLVQLQAPEAPAVAAEALEVIRRRGMTSAERDVLQLMEEMGSSRSCPAPSSATN